MCVEGGGVKLLSQPIAVRARENVENICRYLKAHIPSFFLISFIYIEL